MSGRRRPPVDAGSIVPGATLLAGGGTRFAVAAARAARVEVLIKDEEVPGAQSPGAQSPGEQSPGELIPGERTLKAPGQDGGRIIALAPLPDGDAHGDLCWHVHDDGADVVGRRYRVRVDGSDWRPDPASRWNPDDVHGDSVVVSDRTFRWQHHWTGLAWHRFVIHEIHVGCFTEAGTFAAAIERLPALAALGITAVELMPIADFHGARNWGYDGVLPFAPDASYGTPDDLRRFVDAAHGLGLAVLLDVVYNHFGPEGNYLHGLAPAFFDADKQTPWGAALRVTGPGSAPVRRFFIENAWYWIDSFRLDGLRLDAIHAIHDDSANHLVAELSATVQARLAEAPAGQRREVHLVVENERNQATMLGRDADARPRIATAQWNDDIHHALHVLLTGEGDGYYVDFATAPARLLAEGLANGFIYRGQTSRHAGAPRGEPSAHLPPTAMINFLQNHDQIGNRALGERITVLAEPQAVCAATACVLLGPAIPMLFMGEEFAALSPFLYFCDFDGDLARAVREGRRREFARFERFADPQARDRIPDPTAASTFTASKLRWPADRAEEAGGARARDFRAFVGACLAERRQRIEPLIAHGAVAIAGHRLLDERAFVVRWHFGGGKLALAANLGGPADLALPVLDGCRPVFRPIAATGDTATLQRPLARWDVVLYA